MAYLTTIPATYTDPADTTLVVTEEEILEEVQRTLEEEGVIPHTIYLIDDYTDEEIEIEVADYLTIDQLSLLEVQPIEL